MSGTLRGEKKQSKGQTLEVHYVKPRNISPPFISYFIPSFPSTLQVQLFGLPLCTSFLLIIMTIHAVATSRTAARQWAITPAGACALLGSRNFHSSSPRPRIGPSTSTYRSPDLASRCHLSSASSASSRKLHMSSQASSHLHGSEMTKAASFSPDAPPHLAAQVENTPIPSTSSAALVIPHVGKGSKRQKHGQGEGASPVLGMSTPEILADPDQIKTVFTRLSSKGRRCLRCVVLAFYFHRFSLSNVTVPKEVHAAKSKHRGNLQTQRGSKAKVNKDGPGSSLSSSNIDERDLGGELDTCACLDI